jgi:chemotaxis protein CheD
MRVSNRRDDVLVTYSLGSCVGLALYDAVAVVGGLVHCMLPLAKTDPRRAEANPQMFVDTGVAALLRALSDLGAETSRLIAKVAGAASVLDDKGIFRIGERNCAILREVLQENEIPIAAEDVGGTKARTMFLRMATGEIVIKSAGKEVVL